MRRKVGKYIKDKFGRYRAPNSLEELLESFRKRMESLFPNPSIRSGDVGLKIKGTYTGKERRKNPPLPKTDKEGQLVAIDPKEIIKKRKE